MYSFLNDYSEGCHPSIVSALGQGVFKQDHAYGGDQTCLEGKSLIRAQLNCQSASIFFVATGTLANLVVISALLRPFEAVISADTGHIAKFEAGAIEATGHKVITISTSNGKLVPSDILEVIAEHSMRPHTVRPRMVYISNATETGVVYRKRELEALSKCCRENELLLYLDGARLGVALSSSFSDLTLEDITRLTDVFWIGGTKAGVMAGEAIVVSQPSLARDFPVHIKQRGGLIAKGRFFGIQFKELFSGDLFRTVSEHANRVALILASGFQQKGYELLHETQTNQVFVMLPDPLIDEIGKHFEFGIWSKHSECRSVVRIVTSWSSDTDQAQKLIDMV